MVPSISINKTYLVTPLCVCLGDTVPPHLVWCVMCWSARTLPVTAVTGVLAPTSETALAGATIFMNLAAFTGAVNGYPKVPLWCQNPFGLHVP